MLALLGPPPQPGADPSHASDDHLGCPRRHPAGYCGSCSAGCARSSRPTRRIHATWSVNRGLATGSCWIRNKDDRRVGRRTAGYPVRERCRDCNVASRCRILQVQPHEGHEQPERPVPPPHPHVWGAALHALFDEVEVQDEIEGRDHRHEHAEQDPERPWFAPGPIRPRNPGGSQRREEWRERAGKLREQRFDLVLLDMNTPGMGGSKRAATFAVTPGSGRLPARGRQSTAEEGRNA